MKYAQLILLVFLIVSLVPVVKAQPSYLLNIIRWNSYFRVPYIANTSVASHYVYNISNGLEWEIILHQNPMVESFAVNIQKSNLTFHFQPALNKELNVSEFDFVNSTHAILDGVVHYERPINVVDSYAVYHNMLRDNQYATGKLFHLYRPLFIDAENNTSWMNITITETAMTFHLNQTFLAAAVYPVVIDPTFGYDTVGGSGAVISTTLVDYQRGGATESPSDMGTVTTMHGHMRGDGQIKHAIYNDTGAGNEPDYKQQQSSEISTSGSGYEWKNASCNVELEASTDYHLCTWGNRQGGSFDIYLHYDSVSGYDVWRNSDSYDGTWPNTLDPTDKYSNYRYSIFATYTAAAVEQEKSFTPTATLNLHSSWQEWKEKAFSYGNSLFLYSFVRCGNKIDRGVCGEAFRLCNRCGHRESEHKVKFYPFHSEPFHYERKNCQHKGCKCERFHPRIKSQIVKEKQQ